MVSYGTDFQQTRLEPERISTDIGHIEGLAGLPARKLRFWPSASPFACFRGTPSFTRASQATHDMYILLSGVARLSGLNRKGQRVLLEVLGPGDVVGIPSLLPYVRSDLRFHAFTDCQVGVLTPKSWLRMSWVCRLGTSVMHLDLHAAVGGSC